uniref:Uncharacterized protein n=1 Tax=Leptobrachium leishanense TaxID=445787 RepID=A0A8C5MPE8_9ANUR
MLGMWERYLECGRVTPGIWERHAGNVGEVCWECGRGMLGMWERHAGNVGEACWECGRGKLYKNEKVEAFRRQVWEETWRRVHKHNELANQSLKKYTLKANQFADMTLQERTQNQKCPKSNVPKEAAIQRRRFETTGAIPEEVDWRNSGCVTPVKNEGEICDASWAFSAVGVIETRYCLKHNELISFSEQQLLDCNSENDGCCGGSAVNVFEYVEYLGLMRSKDYEYAETAFACLYNPEDVVNINITKYYVLSGEENIAKVLAMDGPVAAVIQFSEDFRFYNGGIYGERDEDCSPSGSRSVTVIGYGSECGTDYWILKNSWGNEWGEKGYARVNLQARNCIKVRMVVAGEIADPE